MTLIPSLITGIREELIWTQTKTGIHVTNWNQGKNFLLEKQFFRIEITPILKNKVFTIHIWWFFKFIKKKRKRETDRKKRIKGEENGLHTFWKNWWRSGFGFPGVWPSWCSWDLPCDTSCHCLYAGKKEGQIYY